MSKFTFFFSSVVSSLYIGTNHRVKYSKADAILDYSHCSMKNGSGTADPSIMCCSLFRHQDSAM